MVVAARSRSSIPVRFTQLLAVLALIAGILPLGPARAVDGIADHLVVSEVVTGGASASDEMIELYNPTASPVPLEGIELIYVSASGATISRRAAWDAGAPSVPAAGHVLVANEAGMYAAIADAVYGTGMAATGGSVAIRVTGGTTAIDAVGWGTATSAWREGATAPAPAAGSSIERLPGGASGSTQDTDDNASDLVERPIAEPQNLGSPPTPDPDATPSPPSPTPVATPEPTVVPSPSASPSATATPPAPAVAIGTARSAPDGTAVTVEGVSLTASDFHDGGGFVADATGGIAVIVDGGAFERGAQLRVTGTVDDRFSQRTIRAAAADVTPLGPGVEPAAATVSTGALGEPVEARLVRLGGVIATAGSTLTTGVAFDVDDGSGTARVIVPTSSGIDLADWARGTSISIVGVVGQRDSTGTGLDGYRVFPRDPADVLEVGTASPTPTPTASPIPSDEPSPSASPSGPPEGVSTIADARAAPKNARLRVRGVVTLPTGIVDAETAVIQDGTAAIVLRLGDDAGTLQRGQHVEAAGMRSTKGGMETLRISEPPVLLGAAAEPAADALRTGDAGEGHEAALVFVRGALVASARRASSGAVSFDIDDGSGPLRVTLSATLEADDEPLVGGAWVEVRGVLGQETTGAQPQRGYRIWPRSADEVVVVAPATDMVGGDPARGSRGDATRTGGLTAAGATGLATGAGTFGTLVVGPWSELGIGGVLWDGDRVVAIDEDSTPMVAAVLGDRSPPMAVELAAATAVRGEPLPGITTVAVGSLVAGGAPVSPPIGKLPSDSTPAWVSLVGRLNGDRLQVGASSASLDYRCDEGDHPSGVVSVTGIALGELGRVVAPCGGIRSAPVVMRATGPVQADAQPSGPLAATASETSDDPRRPLAAGLFVAAALSLVAAGITARRLAPRGSDPGQAEKSTDLEESIEPSTPRLALVRVPREHGS